MVVKLWHHIMKKLIYIWIVFALIACAQHENQRVMEPFLTGKTLTAEKVLLKNVVSPCFMMVKKQSLFLIDVKNDSMLFQYSLPELEYIGKGGVKGQAENEFQVFPMFCRTSSAELYLWGFTPTKIKKFAWEKTDSIFFEAEYDLANYESFNQMHIVRDSLLVYSAIPGEFALKKVNLNVRKESGRIKFKPDDHGETFFYKNRGVMAASDSLIIYAYSYKKQIDFYRIDDMKCCLQLVEDDAPVNVVVGDWEHSIHYYVDIVAGKYYIYALCQQENNKRCLEVFDYSGHSVAKYEFDITPELFDVDEQNGILYGYNSNLEDYLLRYSLN